MLVLKAGLSKLRIDELVFSPDGAMLATPGGAAGVCLWPSPTTNPKSDVIPVPVRSVKRIAFVPGTTTLYAGNDELCALNLSDRVADRLPISPWHSLWFGASPDGAWLVVSEEDRARENCRVTGWAVGRYAAPAWEVVVPGLVWSLPMFSPAGGVFVFYEHRRNEHRTWQAYRVRRNISTGESLDVSPPCVDIPELVTLSHDGRSFACRTRETIRIYPVEGAWVDVPTVVNDSKKHFTGVAFHPSGQYLAATSNDETVKLYDTATWQLAKTFTWNVGRLRSVAFSPDGALAAVGSDRGQVVVWDVDT